MSNEYLKKYKWFNLKELIDTIEKVEFTEDPNGNLIPKCSEEEYLYLGVMAEIEMQNFLMDKYPIKKVFSDYACSLQKEESFEIVDTLVNLISTNGKWNDYEMEEAAESVGIPIKDFSEQWCCLSDYFTGNFQNYFTLKKVGLLTLIAPVVQSWQVE